MFFDKKSLYKESSLTGFGQRCFHLDCGQQHFDAGAKRSAIEV
jgi:hypothetical protein